MKHTIYLTLRKKLAMYALLPMAVMSMPMPASLAQAFPELMQPEVADSSRVVASMDTAQIVAERFPLDMQMPFLGGRLTTKFSYWHPGIDLAIETGTRMKPVASGTVVATGWQYGYGQAVLIDHGQGINSLYAHMAKVTVKPGEKVTADTGLGTVGSTGRSTGPHLHLEVTKDGAVVDPLVLLPISRPNSIALGSK